MQTTFILYEPDGALLPVTVDLPAEPGYDKLCATFNPLLRCRHFEHVSVLVDDKPADMFVDEDGHGRGLPRNERATNLYRTAWLKANPDDDPESLPWIAGPALLSGRRVWF